MTSFTHLHTHSHYSLLSALPTVKELVAAAKEDDMEALALTDAGNLYGAIEFYKECKKQEIKPIIGVDAYVALRTRFDKEAQVDNRRYRLVLLAENATGYKNLIQLVTKSYLEGFYYKPRIDHELMAKHAGGLIALVPSFSGEPASALKQGDSRRARDLLDQYKSWFGAQGVYLEITHHPELDGHEALQRNLKELARESDTPLAAAHDVYYLRPEDRLARETMIKIQGGGTISDERGFDEQEEDFSFISQAKAREYFQDEPEALANTMRIAQRCDLEIEMRWRFPDYEIESGRSPDDELRHLAYEGVPWRGLSLTQEERERLEYELDVIEKKGYAKYFLVVGDFLREARARGILTTIRGSVAGSLVTYVLGVTNVNPLEYKIPFERFLNYERPSAPDVDMDFADDRRDEMIEYAKAKYGSDKVAQIGTFGTMLARAVVRDVARALGHPYSLGDRIAKLIPFGSQGFAMTIDRALAEVTELAELYKNEEDIKAVIDLAKKIEGRARHISVHAAGVVISPDPLTQHVPLQYDPKGGGIITQYNMHAVGEDGVGLLKFDFLGIRNLSILADAVKRAQHNHGVSIDIENIPLDDQKTFAMLARGETMGLFQLGGSGMTRYLKELKPTSIHDINAMVALYRPGPMESIPTYIQRKHNPHLIQYLDQRMETFLDQSLGVIAYQEDVMMIAVNLAGYTWLEADKLRKAMGKKIPAEMEAQHGKLIEGLVKNGMEKARAEKLWKLIEPFAAYGFNKAHAASYGKVAYQTAYMKANYAVEYMAAVLTADSGDVEKVAEAVAECTRMDIKVLPPDVNESFGDFTVVGGEEKAIRFGLTTIKNFGEGIAEAIIEERESRGKFTTLAEFLERIQHRNLNRKSLEALVKAGALDSLENRSKMASNLETLLDFSREVTARSKQQDSLFGTLEGGAPSLALPEGEGAPINEQLAWERELLGLYLSGHPLDRFQEQLKKHGTDIKMAARAKEGVPIVVYAIVEDIRAVTAKKGGAMAFLKLADLSGAIEAVCFPSTYTDYKDYLAKNSCLGVKGRISNRNGEKSIVVEKIKMLG